MRVVVTVIGNVSDGQVGVLVRTADSLDEDGVNRVIDALDAAARDADSRVKSISLDED